MAWLKWKSYSIGVVCTTGMSATAGSTSNSFRGHNDQAEIHSNRTTEMSSMSTSFGKLNVIQRLSLFVLTVWSNRTIEIAVLSFAHFQSMCLLPVYRPLSTAVLRWAHES